MLATGLHVLPFPLFSSLTFTLYAYHFPGTPAELISMITSDVLITKAFCVPKILINKKVKIRSYFLYKFISFLLTLIIYWSFHVYSCVHSHGSTLLFLALMAHNSSHVFISIYLNDCLSWTGCFLLHCVMEDITRKTLKELYPTKPGTILSLQFDNDQKVMSNYCCRSLFFFFSPDLPVFPCAPRPQLPSATAPSVGMQVAPPAQPLKGSIWQKQASDLHKMQFCWNSAIKIL